jgi:hypothetical protein
MADAPPQLGEIPQQSELNVPTMKSQIDGNAAYGNGNGNFNANNPYQNVKESLYHSEVSSPSPTQKPLVSSTSLTLLLLVYARASMNRLDLHTDPYHRYPIGCQ